MLFACSSHKIPLMFGGCLPLPPNPPKKLEFRNLLGSCNIWLWLWSISCCVPRSNCIKMLWDAYTNKQRLHSWISHEFGGVIRLASAALWALLGHRFLPFFGCMYSSLQQLVHVLKGRKLHSLILQKVVTTHVLQYIWIQVAMKKWGSVIFAQGAACEWFRKMFRVFVLTRKNLGFCSACGDVVR